MASYNRVIIVGNLTRDPEMRYTASGTPVAALGIAINDRRKDASGQWVDDTVFVDVTAWSRSAEIAAEYLTKGSPVLIEGRLKLESWQTQEGQKRSKLTVVADRLKMLGQRDRATAPEPSETATFTEADVPF